MTNEEIIERAKKKLLLNYKQQPIALVKGEGVYVWDADGKRYLDLLGGIATCALGHCHPQVTAAAKAQLDQLWHCSNVFYSEPQVALAEKLTAASGLPNARAFFCNSGAEANEALIKLARRAQKDRGQSGRYEILTFENSFHGRTLATLTATGQPKYQAGFEPLPEGFRHLPYGDLAAVKAAISSKTAAILVEPIQGEGGVRPAPQGFLKALRALCDEHRLLLLIDEVQTGLGRTGKPFAYQHEGVLPDAFSLAKALGNGLPIGAMVSSEEASKALPSGTHGSTFGGNLVTAAAANVAFALCTEPQTMEQNVALGRYAHELVHALQQKKPDVVKEFRGRGLLFGIELASGAADVVARCRQNGLLVNLAGEKTVRFAPPYIVTREQLAEGLSIFERSL
ncbi:MAG: aspartate aminotransferase family protein [Archangiaceae bacterium]|nr:aspartate aminotransferase family protein [Archangiaceae bacterium]